MNDPTLAIANDPTMTQDEQASALLHIWRDELAKSTAQRAAYQSMAEICEHNILSLMEVIEEMEKLIAEPTPCPHEWVDARNSHVISGSYCRLCGAMKAENTDD